jgi:integrase
MTQDELDLIKGAIQEGNKPHYKGENILLTDYIESWLTTKHDIDLRSNKAYQNYENTYKKYIKPFFKDDMLTDITRQKVQDFVISLQKKGLQPITIKDAISCVLGPPLREAAEIDEYIPRNPCKGVHLPRITKRKKDKGFTDKEVQKLLNVVIRNHYQWIALPILIETGMRRSELLALEWKDLIYNEQGKYWYIQINKAYVSDGHGKAILEDCNKTEAGTRNQPITNELASLMLEYRENTQHNNSLYIISQMRHNKRVNPDNFSRTTRNWCKKAGIEKKGPHAFRHLHADHLIKLQAQGKIDITLACKNAGWKDTRMPLYYASDEGTEAAKATTAAKVGDYCSQLYNLN